MRIGVLGGGQLGRMLALAGYPLGFRFGFYDSVSDAPAGQVGPLTIGAFDDHAKIAAWAPGFDAITYEFENVPVASVEALNGIVPVRPGARALAESQDRVIEKTLFRRLGIATPEFEAVSTRDELDRATKRLGFPCVLKTRRLGYDGKGQAVLRSAADAQSAWNSMHGAPGGLILEAFVKFDRELSILAVGGAGGDRMAQKDAPIAFYPLVENHHEDGILRWSIAPGPRLDPRVQRDAEEAARALLDALDYVGVLAIEWFQVGDRLLANEMAPRVHNSGHWSIEGAETSQFENHVRAIAGMPLGSTSVRGAAAMLNLIGSHPSLGAMLAERGSHVHLYGKEPRAGRKIGHVTIMDRDHASIAPRLESLRALIARV